MQHSAANVQPWSTHTALPGFDKAELARDASQDLHGATQSSDSEGAFANDLEALQCSLQCLFTIFPQLKSANGLLYLLFLFSSSVHCLRMLKLCLILIRFLS